MIRNLVFGQLLIEHDVITSEILHKALAIQEKEKLEDKKTSPRLLGRILLEEFQSFKDEEWKSNKKCSEPELAHCTYLAAL